MDRRWVPAGAAAAAAVLVSAVVLVLSGGDEPGRVATLPPPRAADPVASQDAAGGSSGADASPSTSADPDTPTSSDDKPTSAPEPGGSPATTSAPARPAPPPGSPAPAPKPAPSPTRTSKAQPSPAPPVGDRSSFGFDAAYGTDEPREVVVQYGDSSSCPRRNVRHTVKETAERVVVTLEADAQDPGRACTTDYRQMLVPVALQQPLGDRVLVDGSRGEPVEVDRSCTRQFDNPPPPKDCKP